MRGKGYLSIFKHYEHYSQAAQSIARNLLATGMDPAQIAAVTGLTLEQIRELQN